MLRDSRLPAIPKPPHDPTFWLLSPETGWSLARADKVEVAPSDGALTLARLPGGGGLLGDASGGFGGLVAPANVALGPRGEIYLLDRRGLELKRFDPCECRFDIVPCFGGSGAGPRQLSDPHGIGICSGNLYVCDTGNRRVSVFALRGFTLRAHWAPPAESGFRDTWTPWDVDFDGRGRVYVTDPANGCVHRFGPTGRWDRALTGLGAAHFLAIDCRDRLHLVESGASEARVVDTEGAALETVARLDALGGRFPALPFRLEGGGLHLGDLCVGRAAPGQGAFDLEGFPLAVSPPLPAAAYEKEGAYFSQPLDSKLYRCQWHRVILTGEVGPGSRVTVSTFTAEALLDDEQIQALPPQAWETNQALAGPAEGEWDCLVRSGGGRYLWLRLVLRGTGVAAPRLRRVRVEFPRISLRRYLPAVFSADPDGAAFTDRFLSLFDETLRSVERTIDTQARFYDPLSTPATRDPETGVDFLSWLASWIGVSLDRQWPEEARRRFLKQAAALFPLRGTREGLRRQLLLFLGMEPERVCCEGDGPRSRCRPDPVNCRPASQEPCAWQPPPLILEHYQLRRWLFVGAGRLGEQAVLWGRSIVNRSQLNAGARVEASRLITSQDPLRDPFHVYAHRFSVFVPACFGRSPGHRRALENLLKAESPGHTAHSLVFVEPRFRIGVQSMIGLDSVVGRYPEGVTLGESPLGRDTVLGSPPHKQGEPSLEVGREARIGTTTRLG